MSLFSKREKDKTILVLDTQSSIVRASVIVYSGKLTPKIVFTVERKILYRPQAGVSDLIKSTLDSLKECIDISLDRVHSMIKRDDGQHMNKISEIHFVLSSPWIVSKAKTISQTFPRVESVTKKGVMEIIAKERVGDIPGNDDLVEIVEEKIFRRKAQWLSYA